MKYFKLFLGANAALCFLLLSFSTHLTSCTKEVVHDTTTVTIHDTISVTDTVCHLADGLVAHYDFSDGSLIDASGNNNDIIFNSATATADRYGHPNSAYLFNGSSSYMRVANSTSLNPTKSITLMATVKVNDFYLGTCHANQIIGKSYPDNSTGYYNLRYNDEYGDCYGLPIVDQEFFVGTYGDDVPQGTASGAKDTTYIQKGQWYNVIYTFDGYESRIYVNGILKGIEQKKVNFTPGDHDVFIGRHEDPAFPYYFNGIIDEIRIYDRALCSCEVAKLQETDPQK